MWNQDSLNFHLQWALYLDISMGLKGLTIKS